ncbi:hypothetical protein Lal_00007955 [Lupinus albus]|nr:hypothetical protein Lal_00007955 [Lupinus albus]
MVPATVRRVVVYVAVNTMGSVVNVVPKGEAGHRVRLIFLWTKTYPMDLAEKGLSSQDVLLLSNVLLAIGGA